MTQYRKLARPSYSLTDGSELAAIRGRTSAHTSQASIKLCDGLKKGQGNAEAIGSAAVACTRATSLMPSWRRTGVLRQLDLYADEFKSQILNH